MKSTIHDLMFLIDENKVRFMLLLLIGFILEVVISVVNPIAIKILIDRGIMGRDFRFLIIFGVFMLLFFTLYRLSMLWYKLAFRKLKNRTIKKVTLKQMDAYFQFPYSEIIKNDTGYFLSRVYDESSAAVELTLSTYSTLFISIASFAGALGVCLYLSWFVTLILIVVVPFIYFLSQKFSSKITEKSKEEKSREAEVRNLFGRLIDAYKNIKIFDLIDVANDKINDYFDRYLSVFYSRFRTSGFFGTYSSILLSYQELLILVIAGYEVMRGRMTIGGLMGYMAAFNIVVAYALSIVKTMPALSKIKGDISRLVDFGNLGDKGEKMVGKGGEKVKLSKVNFGYDEEKTIFSDLNFEAKSGEKVIVVGDNGSGKSTFINILLNLLHPRDGERETFTIERISALTLPFYFIPGTLKENVNYDNLTEEKRRMFERLLNKFGLKGYEEKDPTTLSTGEKQKCAIIMTLIKDADLYIFDEPTANVDQKSKDIIMDTILEQTKGRTLIVVLHGEEKYYDKFDRIFNIKKGFEK